MTTRIHPVLLAGLFLLCASCSASSSPSAPGAGDTSDASSSPSSDAGQGDAILVEDADAAPTGDDVGPAGDASASNDTGAADAASVDAAGPLAQGCCLTDADCDDEQVCVGVGSDTAGQCAQAPWPGGCYPGTCPTLHLCLGSMTCGCGEECAPTIGYACAPVEGECCTADSDCPEGAICHMQGAGGTCLRAPGDNACWEDADCGDGQSCQGATVCGCQADCEWSSGLGHCVEDGNDDLAECVARFTGCGCAFEQCMDGFGSTTFYPADAGEFPEDVSEPPELLDVAVGRYLCAYCACKETWEVSADDDGDGESDGLVYTNAVDFCLHILEQDAQCSGCLVEWSGGAG